MLMEFHGWKIECNVETNRRAYARVRRGPEDLPSSFYRNFDAARDRAYPAEVRAFFEESGVDYRCFGDVWIPSKMGTKLTYHGVFHLSGSVLEQGEELIRIGPRFCMTLSTGASQPGVVVGDLVKRHLPIIEVDFETLVPWLLDEPEPVMDELSREFHCLSLRPRVVEVRLPVWRKLMSSLTRALSRKRRPLT